MSDPVDKVLGILATADLITPTVAGFKDVLHQGHSFVIPRDCGWSGRNIARLLHRQGIRTWGEMVINDSITLSVPFRDAYKAQSILAAAQIPIDYGSVDAHSRPAGCANLMTGFASLVVVLFFLALIGAVLIAYNGGLP